MGIFRRMRLRRYDGLSDEAGVGLLIYGARVRRYVDDIALELEVGDGSGGTEYIEVTRAPYQDFGVMGVNGFSVKR